MRRCGLAAALLALALQLNEATASGTATRSELLFKREGHAVYHARVMRGMTVEHALQAIANGTEEGRPGHLASLLGERLHAHAARHARGRGGARLRLRARGAAFEDALQAINGRLSNALLRKDMECTRCSRYESSQLQLMEIVREDVGAYSAAATADRAEIMRAEMEAQQIDARLPGLQAMFQAHESSCESDAEAMRAQVVVARREAEAIGRVLAESPCATGASLVQFCASGAPPGGGRHRGGGGGGALVRLAPAAAVQAQALPPWRRELQEVLLQLQRDARRTAAGGRQHALSRRRLQWRGLRARSLQLRGRRQPPASRRCLMKSNPTCEHLRDRVLQLKAAALSKADRLEANLFQLQNGCKEAQRDYVAQISSLQIRVRDENTGLAEATHEQLTAQEAWRVKQKQLSMLMDEYHSEMKRCNEAIAALQNEVCALQKVRGELAKMEGVKTQAPFQDCEVSEWAIGECSVTCGGGGTRRLVRRVVAVPVQGAACPPLEMEEACGNEACPVDCKTGDWGGWSECTAPCGGGVQERVRRVVQERQHGGQPCRQSADTRQCNVQACNRDCELERWSDWTPCSQTCGGGTTRRSRGVATEPLGLGTCPAPDSEDRVRYRECNVQPCTGPADQQTARCEAKIDLVLLLDGSSAVDDVGWYQLRSAAADILSAMWGGKESVRAAALLFGGQVQASRCGSTAGPLGSLQVDLAVDCGIKWLGHLPDAKAPSALAATIKGLDWPAGSALISVALGAVQTELLGVREGARPVVLVLTAGQPVSPDQVRDAAAELRRSARLMWVPVVRGSASAWPQLEAIKSWASRPLRENVIAVEGYSTLATPAAVRRIVEEVCANPT